MVCQFRNRIAEPSCHTDLYRESGFTLLELVVAVALSAAVIAMSAQLQSVVYDAGNAAANGDRDWSTELFIRSQVRLATHELDDQAKIFVGERHRFRFLSSRSVLYGKGVLVAATYSFQSSSQTLQYEEAVVPPWWDDTLLAYGKDPAIWWHQDERRSWRGTVFSGVLEAEFSFWDYEAQAWQEYWNGSEGFPSLVRLRLEDSQQTREFIIEPEASFFSMSSGP